MNMHTPQDFAEGLAKGGCHVFPCEAAKKTPAIKAWQKHATNDSAKIRRWATQFPGCNWGVAADRFKDGALLILDIDHRDAKDGEASLQALIADQGELPPTFEVASPNGRHLYYSVPAAAVKQGVDVFGPGVDVRSAGGYVVAPGSVLPAGQYTVRDARDVVPAPAWLIDACGQPREKVADRTPLAGVDPVRALQRGIDYLATAPRSVKGAGGDQCAYTVAAKLLALGLDEAGALDLMLSEHWDHGSGWPAERLAQKVRNAAEYMQNPIGADAPEAQFEVVPEAPAKRRYKLLSVGALLSQSPPSWLVRGLLPARGLGVVYGAPGSGKSFLMLDLAAAIARGIAWAGQRVKRGAVVYIGLEGQVGPRVSAYLREHDVQAQDVAGLHIIERQGLNLLQEERVDVRQLIADILASEVGTVAMVVVDTLNRAMPGGNENASEDMGRAIRCAGEVSAALDCLCVFVHHSGKDAGKGARGHSSLLGAADAELEVSRGADGESRFLEATKVKDGQDGSRFAFRLKAVDLGATRDHDPEAEAWERDVSCVVDALALAAIGASGKARKWTPARTNALAALRAAIDGAPPAVNDWQGKGPGCTIDQWRDAYSDLVPVGELTGTELRQAQNSRTRTFTNAVDWLTAENVVAVRKEKGHSVYRIETVE